MQRAGLTTTFKKTQSALVHRFTMTNSKIGFNDSWLMIFGMLSFSFLIPVMFFGAGFSKPPYYDKVFFFTALVSTAVIWLGNRYIMIYARNRFPDFGQVKKRLSIQAFWMFGYTLIANNVFNYIFKDICRINAPGRSLFDVLLNSNLAAFFCTLTVVLVYESVYLIGELKKSIGEKEMLKRESLLAQWNALKTQVNPHFLFNNLNTLASIIPDNPAQAVTFTQEMARVYRHILEVRDEQSIPLSQELEVLEAYAFLLKTRFTDSLDITIKVAAEKLDQRIVPLSLQILMENAIKHNVVSAARPLHIDVFTEDGRLVIRNTLQKKRQFPESTGIGLENIRNRYRLLGDHRQMEVSEEHGSFTVSIPLLDPKYGSTDHRR